MYGSYALPSQGSGRMRACTVESSGRTFRPSSCAGESHSQSPKFGVGLIKNNKEEKKRNGHHLARNELDVIKLMVETVDNIKPICEVIKVGVAGTVYDVPGIVARNRQQTLAIRWIMFAAVKRRISYRISLEKCLFAEILDAYNKKGIAHKRRENLHGLASTNRNFAHFRWW
nr:ribosomal protein S7 [Carex sp. SCSB-B-000526]